MNIEKIYSESAGFTIFMVKSLILSTEIHHLMRDHILPSSSALMKEITSLKIGEPTFIELPDQTPWLTFWINNGKTERVTIGTLSDNSQKYVIVDVAIKGKHV